MNTLQRVGIAAGMGVGLGVLGQIGLIDTQPSLAEYNQPAIDCADQLHPYQLDSAAVPDACAPFVGVFTKDGETPLITYVTDTKQKSDGTVLAKSTTYQLPTAQAFTHGYVKTPAEYDSEASARERRVLVAAGAVGLVIFMGMEITNIPKRRRVASVAAQQMMGNASN